MIALLVLVLAILLVAPSCTGNEREEILVFAAASLTDVMEQLGQQFTDRGGVRVNFNLGGSTVLSQQIIRGAPADAFVSAGAEPMDILVIRNLLMPDTHVDVLTNELVLVSRLDGGRNVRVASLEDLNNEDVRVAIADPDLAPAGRYAREALMNLGLWRKLQPRLVPAPDVRAALGYVVTGNVDAGIVYRTDAPVVGGLQIVASIPNESHSPIVYPAAVLVRTRHVNAARRFLAFLTGEEAKETFRQHGFMPPPPSTRYMRPRHRMAENWFDASPCLGTCIPDSNRLWGGY